MGGIQSSAILYSSISSCHHVDCMDLNVGGIRSLWLQLQDRAEIFTGVLLLTFISFCVSGEHPALNTPHPFLFPCWLPSLGRHPHACIPTHQFTFQGQSLSWSLAHAHTYDQLELITSLVTMLILLHTASICVTFAPSAFGSLPGEGSSDEPPVCPPFPQ